ncbi:MAG: phytoene desaturase [Micrococcales bacterium]|nr:phytoene desaturase [Micrococcales bacterium]
MSGAGPGADRAAADDPAADRTAVVIGGGIAGLATAALLAREGYRTTLLEARDELGGRAGSWERDGFRFDTGPSWYLMPEVFEHFYRLLGTTTAEQLDLVTLDPGYRIWAEGHPEPLDVPRDTEATLALAEAIEPGAGERIRSYLAEAGDTYRMALGSFLYTTFAKLGPILRGGAARRMPALARLLSETMEHRIARTVQDRRLRQLLGYPAVFLGAAPRLAPSMYSLMSHLDLVDGVRYPMGGFTRLIRTIADLAAAEGVELRTSARVARIEHAGGAATGVTLEPVDGRPGERIEADVVVSTADLHHTETRLIQDPAARTYPEEYWAKRTPGPSALLILLGVDGTLPQLEHHSLFFAEDWQKGFDAIFGDRRRRIDPSVPETPSIYVCKPSEVDPSVAPAGAENLFVLVPLPADPAGGPSLGRGGIRTDTDAGGDPAIEELADRVIAQISGWAGIPDLADRIRVRRTIGPGDFTADLGAWRGTALGPAHTLRQSALFRSGNRSRLRNLYFAGGSTIPGIGLPMCLISAELVIKRMRDDTSTGPLPEPLAAARVRR